MIGTEAGSITKIETLINEVSKEKNDLQNIRKKRKAEGTPKRNAFRFLLINPVKSPV
jgi:hypothetical protein